MIKLATVFSGIGAVEHALNRMDINTEIVFACDNGERYLSQSFEEINAILDNFTGAYREQALRLLWCKAPELREWEHLLQRMLPESYRQEERPLNR